jgi:molecular chaperone DnaJ
MSDDYYQTLGVDRGSSDAELKKAYKRLAAKWHPDRHQNSDAAKQKFQKIQEAYAVLSDSKKRTMYDQYGKEGVNASGQQQGFDDMGDVLNNIFGDIFGGGGFSGRASRQDTRGSDLSYTLDVTLQELLFGTKKEISFQSLVNCETCDGSGAKPGSKRVNCSQCHGHGQVQINQGFISVRQTCPACQGQGTRIEQPCSSCRGQGRHKKARTVMVNIPVGLESGDRMRLSGQGEAGVHGGTSGDLYIEIRQKPDATFERKNQDLHTEIPIPFHIAVLGGQVNVPTIDGEVALKIPEATQTGSLFRLRGKGVPKSRRHSQGDLICRVKVEIPAKLSTKQKECIQAMVDDGMNEKSPKSAKWLDTARSFFAKSRSS